MEEKIFELKMLTTLEQKIETEKKVYNLETEPMLLYSPYLSNKTGLEVSILDYSQTSTGTHKLQKAVYSAGQAKENNQNALLFINPVVSPAASGIQAMEIAAAIEYPDSHVVSVIHSDKPYIKPEPINKDFPERKKRIVWGINLHDFWSREKLENYFEKTIQGKTNLDSRQIKEVRKLIGEDFNCVDLTNIDDCSCYNYSENLIKQLEKFDYLVGSAGTGERAIGQIDSINGKLNHVIVIPDGHPLDPFHRYEESDSKRVQTRFRVRNHDRLFGKSIERKDIVYKSAGLFGGKQAQKMFVDKAIKEDGFNMATGPDGAIGFTILRDRYNPEHQHYFNEKGLRVFNTHRASEKGFNYIYNTIIPYDSKICIVNTGISNNDLLKKLIARGAVK